MDSALHALAHSLFGEKLRRRQPRPPKADGDSATGPAKARASSPVNPALNLTLRQQRRLWRHVETIENFWESLREIEPGAVRRLASVAAARRWEVIFLTKRPPSAGATAQVQTQRWLVTQGFERPCVYVVQGSRGRIAAALELGVVVDDRHDNCCDVVVDSAAQAILVWRQRERQLSSAAERLGVRVVASVGECLDVLTRADEAGNAP